MQRVKLGIIGLGLAWERLHAPALARLSDKYAIVAVCDKDIAKAKRVAAHLGLSEGSVFSDHRKMLARPDIEAVESLVPISQNFEVAADVIRADKHLIAEKPFASTPEAARELIAMRDKANVKIMVAENVRYEEQNILIKSLIENGQIGNPVYFIDNHVVEYQQESAQGGFGQTDWRQEPRFEGGVIMDSGVHHVARTRFLFGDAVRVFAHGRPSGLSFSPYSCINATLQFPENIAGQYSFFLTGKEAQAPLVGLRIFGTHGEIFLEEPHCGFVNISYKDSRPAVAIAYNAGQGYFHELEDFFGALRGGGKITSTPEKALGDIQTVFALLESARLGEAISPTNAEKITKAFFLPKVTSYPGARA